ncbi:MAG: hypothetical protein P4L68_11625 [Methylovirgula sp.]|nr:hypothetical protein [Methylovirgula sp.]
MLVLANLAGKSKPAKLGYLAKLSLYGGIGKEIQRDLFFNQLGQ